MLVLLWLFYKWGNWVDTKLNNLFNANFRQWRSWAGSGLSEFKAHYAKLSLSGLLGCHSSSQLLLLKPPKLHSTTASTSSPPTHFHSPTIWFLPLASSTPSKLLFQRSLICHHFSVSLCSTTCGWVVFLTPSLLIISPPTHTTGYSVVILNLLLTLIIPSCNS